LKEGDEVKVFLLANGVLVFDNAKYVGQPELSPEPRAEPMAIAAEDAFFEFYLLAV